MSENCWGVASKKSLLHCLKRVERQLGGVTRMIEDGRYCIDIITQRGAGRAGQSSAGIILTITRDIESPVARRMIRLSAQRS
jgi:DNA-binding FrmR family transcriptional regulator